MPRRPPSSIFPPFPPFRPIRSACRLAFAGSCLLSLLACLAVTGLWAWARLRGPGGCSSGFYHYTPHPGYHTYEDAWQVRLLNAPGHWVVCARRRGCVRGPDGRLRVAAREDRLRLSLPPGEVSAMLDDAESALRDDPHTTGAAGVRYVSLRYLRAVSVPHAASAGLLAVLPAAAAAGRALRRRRLRRRRGLCPECGYDLRATPEGPEAGGALLDRCPECGAVPMRRSTKEDT